MTAIGHTSGVDTGRVSLDRVIEVAVATGVVLLVIIGFVTSYETLRLLAATDGGFPAWLAPAVPLSFDLGIVILSLKVVAAARQGRPARLLRAMVAALSVSSVAVNSTASTSTAGRLLHAVPPAMFVICFESLISSARHARRTTRRQSGEIMRWLLAPVTTMRAWRRLLLAADEPRRRKRQAAGPSRQETPAPSPGTPASATDKSRLRCVRDALERAPGLSAPQLREHLSQHGFDVSVRTAQRLRARVTSS